ncbi:hypothetical protein CLORY_26310 [Clostridium oryzae]|uniref:Uncharacterized protein n=1 Tax=Clostridium oryzae TaxID=1450648 RepID=A0A1V4ILI8_9CLOT|nr:hypothetical protein CLORY_26310 [Clostridium oryzae]
MGCYNLFYATVKKMLQAKTRMERVAALLGA